MVRLLLCVSLWVFAGWAAGLFSITPPSAVFAQEPASKETVPFDLDASSTQKVILDFAWRDFSVYERLIVRLTEREELLARPTLCGGIAGGVGFVKGFAVTNRILLELDGRIEAIKGFCSWCGR